MNMGVTKTEQFTDTQNEIATLLKAIAHPARVAILEYLLQINTCICGDIVHEVALSQSTVSQHLKELKSAGLIKGTIEGTAICYCIDEQAIAKLQAYFTDMIIQLKAKKANCC